MTSQLQIKSAALHEQDFNLWVDETVENLKSGNFTEIDLKNLIEEVESLGSNHKHALFSYLKQLCLHLLKIQYWESERDYCLRGWDIEVDNFRDAIQNILQISPSLKNYLVQIFNEVYIKARRRFIKESQLESTLIPEEPPFTLTQALDENWLPWQSQKN